MRCADPVPSVVPSRWAEALRTRVLALVQAKRMQEWETRRLQEARGMRMRVAARTREPREADSRALAMPTEAPREAVQPVEALQPTEALQRGPRAAVRPEEQQPSQGPRVRHSERDWER